MKAAGSRTPVTIVVRVALVALAFAGWTSVLAQEGDERRGNMTVLKSESALYAETGRAGLLGFLGHDHAITAEEWSASLCWPADGVEGAFLDMVVPTASTRIDTARGRRLADLDSSPGANTIADLQEDMLGQEYLDAEAYPELRFTSTSVSRPGENAADEADVVVEGELTIHGTTNPVTLAVVTGRDETGPFIFSTQTTFRMTDFGITPENTAGLVAVADDMELHVEIVAQRTRAGCG